MLGLIVLAHRLPEQLAVLVGRLQDPRVRVYLHIDKRSSLDPFLRALQGLPEEPVLLQRYASRWGGPEVVDATLGGLRRAASDGCDYVMLLSGQDFPVWPTERLLDFVSDTGTRSYVAHFPLPDPRWRQGGRIRTECYTYTVRGRRETCIPRGMQIPMSRRGRVLNEFLRVRSAFKPRRRFPDCALPFGGSQWWNLSRVAVEHILSFVETHPGYRMYHEHTLLPDEIFFQSILLGTDFACEHEVVNDSLRFMIWEEDASHPRTLTCDDLPAIVASGKPVARKFDTGVDRVVLDDLGLDAD